jgi:TPP-dependent pyruvate/acetoin dehydrogenase alpha subunit
LIKQEDIDSLVKEADRVVKEAVDFAEAGSWEPAGDITKFVYSENTKP